jgi:hypothetical protein
MQLDLYKSVIQYGLKNIIDISVGTIMVVGKHEQKLHVDEFTLEQLKYLKKKIEELENSINYR